MNRTLIRWMRVVLPRSEFATICIAVEMAIEILYLLVLWSGRPDEIFFRNLRLSWLGMSAFVYGVYRVAAFHPVFNEEYQRWLQSTPWTADKPLLAGPLQQVPQDLIVLAALMLLTRETSQLVCWLPAAFLVGYLTALAVATRAVEDWAFAYLLGFGLGAVALAGDSALMSCVVAMACYPVGFLAIRRSLARFPWQFDWKVVKNKLQSNPSEKHQERLGWPHDFMSPAPPKLLLPYADGVCLSLMIGWFAFVTHYHGAQEFRVLVCALAMKVLTITAIGRAVEYVRAHRPPISFWGRIWTGRWIIPSYDTIFVAPLLAEVILLSTQIGAMAVFFANGRFANRPIPATNWLGMGLSSGGIAATLFVLCVMGPVLRRWRLTGTHRIVFDLSGLGSRQSNSPFMEL